jgi:MFS family permease
MAHMGSWIQNAAQAWLVYDLTHAGTALGFLVICQFGPLAAFGLFGAAVVDRYGARTTLLWTQTGLMACATVLAAFVLSESVNIMTIFVIAAIRSLLLCATIPARQKFVIDIVGSKNVSNALGLNAAAEHFARITGPALAGATIAIAGVGICFAAHALSFLGVIYAAYWIQSDFPAYRDENARTPSLLASLGEVFWYIGANRHLLILLIVLFLVTFIPMSFGVTLPIFILKTMQFNSTAYGVLLSSLGLGSLVGSLVVASRSKITPEWMFGSSAGLGVVELLLVFVRDAAVIAVALVLAGFCMTFVVAAIHSIVLACTKERFLARVGALSSYIVLAIAPLGSSISGWLSDVGGTNLAFGVGGFVAVTAAATVVIAKRTLAPAWQA